MSAGPFAILGIILGVLVAAVIIFSYIMNRDQIGDLIETEPTASNNEDIIKKVNNENNVIPTSSTQAPVLKIQETPLVSQQQSFPMLTTSVTETAPVTGQAPAPDTSLETVPLAAPVTDIEKNKVKSSILLKMKAILNKPMYDNPSKFSQEFNKDYIQFRSGDYGDERLMKLYNSIKSTNNMLVYKWMDTLSIEQLENIEKQNYLKIILDYYTWLKENEPLSQFWQAQKDKYDAEKKQKADKNQKRKEALSNFFKLGSNGGGIKSSTKINGNGNPSKKQSSKKGSKKPTPKKPASKKNKMPRTK